MSASRDLPGLTNIAGTHLSVEDGARLTLPGVTGLVQTNNANLTFRASGAGSVLRLPQVTQAMVPNYYQLELFAYDGGRVELPSSPA